MALDDLPRIGKPRTAEAPPRAPAPGPRSALVRALGVVRRHKLAAAGIAAVLVLAAAYLIFSGETAESGEPIIVTVSRGDIEDTVTALGSLQPKDYVDVGAQVSGQLKTIAVQIGDQVQKGQFLAEIDSTVQAAKVQADRDLLQGLQAQLAEKLAQANLAHAQAARQAALFRIGGTSKDALQVAEAAARSADAQVAAVKAQIAQAQSQLNGDSATFGYSKIYAPMAGTVVSITAMQGQTLNASQQAPVILRIADLSTMTVWTQVSEADVPKLHVGMGAYFTTLGAPDKRWTGTLRQILPTPEVVNNVVLYTALFDVANPNRTLMPQMTAQVFFVASSAHNVITVPVAALHYGRPDGAGTHRGDWRSRHQGQAQDQAQGQTPGQQGQGGRAAHTHGQGRPGWVTVAKDDGTTEVHRVRVGVSNRVSAEILSGLAVGEHVVAGTKQDSDSGDTQQRGSGRRGGGRFGGPHL